MTNAYPIRSEPLFRDYLWGGRNLETVLNKNIPSEGVWAESWEMVDHPEHQSRITNGVFQGETLADLASKEPEWLFGTSSNRPDKLPLLLKYLDCQKVLSVQVHPDDVYGLKMTPPDLGKTEAWVVISAQPGAKLYAGLSHGTTPDSLRAAIESGDLESCLHCIEPQAGDCVFIPAGTVHALGAGLLIAEIQQASNTTFRLFDWNRVGADGKPRPLHIQQALEVIDFDSGPRPIQTPRSTDTPGREQLVHCEKFVLDRLRIASTEQAPLSAGGDGRMHLLTAPLGGVTLTWKPSLQHNNSEATELEVGQSVLLPACIPPVSVALTSEAVLLDMYLP